MKHRAYRVAADSDAHGATSPAAEDSPQLNAITAAMAANRQAVPMATGQSGLWESSVSVDSTRGAGSGRSVSFIRASIDSQESGVPC
jgi:hypothetical protein